MDIRLDNYRDGKLVDFGSSWTGPHILLDARDEEAADESRLADRTKFSQMVENEKIPDPKKIIIAIHLRNRDIAKSGAGLALVVLLEERFVCFVVGNVESPGDIAAEIPIGYAPVGVKGIWVA
ncbi:hypothetical protein NCS56_01500900 [Fusarium sp. Ph1]|nr:hypothetical protein NCS56_01500900 [Fusarium sp. Ph1]